MALGKPKRVTVRSTDVQRNFRDVVNRAGSGREHIIVERDGLPVIAIISMAEYEALIKEREQRENETEQRLKRFEQAARSIGEEMARKGLSEEDVLAQLEETRAEVYQKHYGKPKHK
jgi:prevent-host-death family protein